MGGIDGGGSWGLIILSCPPFYMFEILQNNFKNALAYSKKEAMIVTKCDLREPGLKHGQRTWDCTEQHRPISGHRLRAATEPLQDG